MEGAVKSRITSERFLSVALLSYGVHRGKPKLAYCQAVSAAQPDLSKAKAPVPTTLCWVGVSVSAVP